MSAGRDREKVKQTKKLVKLALDAGWTEAEIARKCRVTAEKVSTWKNGKARGRRHELKPLLDAFGWRLRRGKMRVYLVVDPDAGPKWEETETGRRLLACTEELEILERQHGDLLEALKSMSCSLSSDVRERAAQALERLTARLASLNDSPRADAAGNDTSADRPLPIEGPVDAVPQATRRRGTRRGRERVGSVESSRQALERQIAAGRRLVDMTPAEASGLARLHELLERFGGAPRRRIELERTKHTEALGIRIGCVPGRVVFSHVFTRPLAREGRTRHIVRHPAFRWVVHFHGDAGAFTVVRQRRRLLSAPRRQAWNGHLSTALGTHFNRNAQVLGGIIVDCVDSSDDAARWVSEIEPPMDLEALLAYVDASIHQPDRPHGPNDEVTLPFLLRKALIEQGFDVPGVVFHGAD